MPNCPMRGPPGPRVPLRDAVWGRSTESPWPVRRRSSDRHRFHPVLTWACLRMWGQWSLWFPFKSNPKVDVGLDESLMNTEYWLTCAGFERTQHEGPPQVATLGQQNLSGAFDQQFEVRLLHTWGGGVIIGRNIHSSKKLGLKLALRPQGWLAGLPQKLGRLDGRLVFRKSLRHKQKTFNIRGRATGNAFQHIHVYKTYILLHRC